LNRHRYLIEFFIGLASMYVVAARLACPTPPIEINSKVHKVTFTSKFPARTRNRALIALMGYTFARVGAAVDMEVQDFYVQEAPRLVLPCHHNLDQYLEEWISVSGLGSEPEAPLFPTLRHGRLTGRTPLPQAMST